MIIYKNSFFISRNCSFFEKALDNSCAYLLVALEGDTVAGYAELWNIAGEGQLMDIAVLPSFRRLHIAQGLLEHLFDYAKHQEISRILLEVRISNDAARNLYQKLGFLEDGIRKEYYQDNREDAVLMSKLL